MAPLLSKNGKRKKNSFDQNSHYTKNQIFVQKLNFDKTPTFSRVFHPKFFWQFFSWNQSCQQLKSPKPQHFHEFFTQKKKNRQFSREIKVEFLDKTWRFGTVCWHFSFSYRFAQGRKLHSCPLDCGHHGWRGSLQSFCIDAWSESHKGIRRRLWQVRSLPFWIPWWTMWST